MSEQQQTESNGTDPSRRSFFVWGSAVISGILVLIPGIPLLRAFFWPSGADVVSGSEGFVEVSRVADFETGVPKRVPIIADQQDAWTVTRNVNLGSVWVTRHSDGSFTVFSTICPHLGCAVDFDREDDRFECPCHVSAFAKSDGKMIFGPSPRGLDPLEWKVDGGRLFVDYKRFIIGSQERQVA